MLSRSAVGALLLLGGIPAAVIAQGTVPVAYVRAWSTEEHAGEMLFRPVDVEVTPDCTVWVPDAGNARVYRWRCDGRALPALGRKGEGPGEFDGPSLARHLRGDTVAIWDRGTQRLTFFGRDGQRFGERAIQVSGGQHGFVRAFALPYPEPLFATHVYPASVPRPIDGSVLIWGIDPGGRASRQVLRLSGPPVYVDRQEGASMRLDAPFSSYPAVLFSRGENAWVVDLDRGAAFRYTYGARMREAGRFGFGIDTRAVTRAERARWRDSVSAAARAEMDRAGLDPAARAALERRHEALRDRVRFPERHPVARMAVLDERDRLWLLLSDAPSGRRRWTVHDGRTGRRLRTVDLPGTGRIVAAHAFGEDLFVIETEVDNVPRVTRYTPTR